MDQLRKAWGWLQRQHFWVLTLLALLVALGCWWRGGSTLWADYKTNRGRIDEQFNKANSVKTKPFHANENVQSGQNEQIAQQQETVFALWKQLYERQTASVLKWPSNLSRGFREHITKLTFGADIPPNLRRHYNNYIRDHFPELPKIVGALEVPDSGQGGGGMPGMGGGGAFNVQSFLEGMRGNNSRGGEGDPGLQFEEPDFLVVWADQQMIRDELAPRSTPTPKRIWKTQEDLWVLEALLTIIANTNKAAGSDRFSNAAVRVIESLEVGRTAAQASRGRGRIDMVEMAAPGMMEGGEGMTMEGGRGGGMEGGGYGEYGGGGRGMGMEGEYGGEMGGRGMGMGTDGAAADADLFNNRYVGADGAPIPDPGDGSLTAFGTEFKRLPVRMQLWMDQRWLPQLISECANAPLQVEVQEVRINPADGGASGGGYGGGGYGGGGRGGDSYASAGAMGVEMMPESEPMMKTVVLQGTVYIFNPPSAEPATVAALPDAAVQ
jgi:hypothetical protein